MSIEILVIVGMLAGLMGPFLLIKRQTLAVDAIAHGSFGGAAIAYFYGINPLYGALVFAAAIAYLLTMYFKQKQEIVLGLTLVLGMSLGLIFFMLAGISKENIIHYLFGNMDITPFKALLIILTASIAFIYLLYNSRVIFSVFFDPEGSRVRGIDVVVVEGIFNGILAVAIVSMLSIVGALLVSGLMILPALISQIISKEFKHHILLSSAIGGMSMLLGYYFNPLSLPLTPYVIFVLAFVYGLLRWLRQPFIHQ